MSKSENTAVELWSCEQIRQYVEEFLDISGDYAYREGHLGMTLSDVTERLDQLHKRLDIIQRHRDHDRERMKEYIDAKMERVQKRVDSVVEHLDDRSGQIVDMGLQMMKQAFEMKKD